jgi:hypothetical protein
MYLGSTTLPCDSYIGFEIDAIATIVAKVLPVYFPNKVFVEEGCYVIPGDNYNILGVLSPDGSIRNRTGDKANISRYLF